MPAAHATAAILSVGDELTLGQTLDTNSRWLADRLSALGVITIQHATVADDSAAQTSAIRRLAAIADLLIITGGLGPTADDLTRDALAAAMDDSLTEDPLALAQVESWFLARARAMPPINRVQALRPSRGQTLLNLNGTAPGLHGVIIDGDHECDVFCLPGPPREMQPMFESQIVPRLHIPVGRTVRTRFLHSFGMGESDVATRLGPLMDRARSPLVGTTVSAGVVTCRIRYEGPLSPDEADDAVAETERAIRTALGAYIFGSGTQTLPEAVFSLLREREQTLSTVESCTGGLLGALVTDIPGSSTVFLGGLVTYSNQLKQSLAGVDAAILSAPGPGAVSAECARAMAVGGLSRLNSDHCLAVTGIAGPGGEVPAQGDRSAKPVGTVFIARASRDKSVDVRRFLMAGDRRSIREWSATAALGLLRLHLIGAPDLKLLRQVALDHR